MQNNVVGQTKRAFTSALVIGFGGIGGIVASLSFRTKDIPYYRSGCMSHSTSFSLASHFSPHIYDSIHRFTTPTVLSLLQMYSNS
jgi:kynureninase